jgi:hypothetical protein
VRLTSPEAADRWVSPASKLALHKGAHTTIYVEPRLTQRLSQQQARRNVRSKIQQLQRALPPDSCTLSRNSPS